MALAPLTSSFTSSHAAHAHASGSDALDSTPCKAPTGHTQDPEAVAATKILAARERCEEPHATRHANTASWLPGAARYLRALVPSVPPTTQIRPLCICIIPSRFRSHPGRWLPTSSRSQQSCPGLSQLNPGAENRFANLLPRRPPHLTWCLPIPQRIGASAMGLSRQPHYLLGRMRRIRHDSKPSCLRMFHVAEAASCGTASMLYVRARGLGDAGAGGREGACSGVSEGGGGGGGEGRGGQRTQAACMARALMSGQTLIHASCSQSSTSTCSTPPSFSNTACTHPDRASGVDCMVGVN